jgi:L-ascorbate metabolism protein UlaG (beta-lactamase superfamily)
MRLTRFQAFAVAAAVVLLAGCAHVIPGDLTGTGEKFAFAKHGCRADLSTDDSKVEVRYLGSGGAFIQWRGDAILLGASFSNPGYLRAYFWRGREDTERIRQELGKMAYQNVRAILAGHSHYDHIGDLPAVARLIPNADIYLNASGANIVAAEDPKLDVRTITAGMEPIAIGTSFRVTPIRSAHAQQLCRWNVRLCRYAWGDVPDARDTPMARQRLRTMRAGEILAFDIELLDASGAPRYRIYYNDSSPASPLGQTAGPFDLAILTMAQWKWADGYPQHLLEKLQPKHVLISHWDNFFRKAGESSKFVPRLDARGFLQLLHTIPEGASAPVNDVCGVKTARYTMPVPGSSLLFNPR